MSPYLLAGSFSPQSIEIAEKHMSYIPTSQRCRDFSGEIDAPDIGEEELRKLTDDLSGRVSAAATSVITDIYRSFIQNGFTSTRLFPVLDGNAKERQDLMLGSVMASLFYAERQMVVAANHLQRNLVRTNDISLDECEKLFQFAQDLAFDFTTQMILFSGKDKALKPRTSLH